PSTQRHVLHEKRQSTSSQWLNLGPVEPDSKIVVRVGLKQSDLHKAHEYLMDVSHPKSPNYGKFWTQDQVIQAFAPSDETASCVHDWLARAGIDKSRILHTENKGWLAFEATGSEVENLLKTQYYNYKNTITGQKAVACEKYHVPDNVQNHIDYINPGIRLPKVNRRSLFTRQDTVLGPVHEPKTRPFAEPVNMGNLSSCDIAITPKCIQALYQIPPANSAQDGNSMGLFEEGDYYAGEDLDLFFKNMSPNIPQGTRPILNAIDGGSAPVSKAKAGVESDLDMQLAYPIIYPQTLTLFQTDDSNYATGKKNSNGFLDTFLDAIDGSYCTSCYEGLCGSDLNVDPVYPDETTGGYNGSLMCGTYKAANVISVSYGGQEHDFPEKYQRRQCNEFMKLGMRGVSVFFASGDNGVAGPAIFDDHHGCLGSNSTVFNPGFPNNCPYVTNVGATKIPPGKTVHDPEVAVVDYAGYPFTNAFASGGDFSNIYPTPDYQAEAVKKYFDSHNPPYPYYNGNSSFGENGGRYNRLGRGYPDVAANGDNTAIYNKGKYVLSGGTSASAPIFAAVINRIVDERLSKGRPPLGFINPVLYENPQVLNDITSGSNPGCGTDGFSTAPGWDPVTGLGTPNYPKMLDLLVNIGADSNGDAGDELLDRIWF
ncbi:uncharacterized protein TRUGW13939_01552, partial [Talaromyces rugulosus]